MKKIFLILFLSPTFLFSQEVSTFLPTSNGELVHHSYYSLSYSQQHEQAEWVFYEINSNTNLGQVKRTNNFRSDNLISANSASLSDYKGSGFDRGHLAPAADMSFNYIAMSESFLLSNMSPQNASFNRGVWKKLESLVRTWGNYTDIYVVTGPILNSCSTSIGGNNVCVPNYFYKVIYDPQNQKMISFILPNKKGNKSLNKYVCTTDSLEKITNIDFFPILENNLEERLESQIHKELWTWTNSNNTYKSKNTNLANQCKGITQKGKRCKNKIKKSKGYCYYHD